MSSPSAEPRAPRSPRSGHELLAEVHRRADRRIRRNRATRTAVVLAALILGIAPLALRRADLRAERVQAGDGGTTTSTRHPDVLPPSLPDGAPASLVVAGQSEIRVLATDGSGLTRRYPVPKDERAPADETTDLAREAQVSRDGSTAYFLTGSGPCHTQAIKAMGLADGHIDTVLDGPEAANVTTLAVDPAGSSVSLVRLRQCTAEHEPPGPAYGPGAAPPIRALPDYELVVHDLSSGHERVVLHDEALANAELSYSSDGRRVVFGAPLDGQPVRVVDVDAGAVRAVPEPAGCRYGRGRFVPRSNLLAAVEDCSQPPRATGIRLVLIDPDTGEVRRSILDIPVLQFFGPYRIDPSGQHVLYFDEVQFGNGFGRMGFHRLSLADGSTHELYPNPQPEDTRTTGAVW